MSKSITIKEAVELSGYQAMYLKNLCRQGKIKAEKLPIDGTDIYRWQIDREDFERYISNGSNRVGQRSDGRNKFVAYFSEDEVDSVIALLKKNGFEEAADLIKRANPPKSGK